MDWSEMANNETELTYGMEDMRLRLRGLVLSGILTKDYATELWNMYVSHIRRSYIHAENEGVNALNNICDAMAYDVGDEIADKVKRIYMQSIGEGVAVVSEYKLFTPEEKVNV